MKGLSQHTEEVFEQISKMECVKNYTLIGGTALALQLGHRLSEDLDFCKWHKSKYDFDLTFLEKEISERVREMTESK
jgi:hypothetical protein